MHEWEKRIREYEDSLRSMPDNRLRVEWNLVMQYPNKYSGKPVRYKLMAIQSESRRRERSK